MESQVDLTGIGLTEVVQCALARPSVEIGAWEVVQITEGLGPATGGLYRISGTAHDESGALEWSVVLKVKRAPTEGQHVHLTGAIPAEWGCTPSHSQYWKREALLYQSDVLSRLEGISAPKCFKYEQKSEREVWLWLEDIRDSSEQKWPLSRYYQAAAAVGEANAHWLSKHRIPSIDWLNSSPVRAYIADRCGRNIDLIHTASTWRHPLVIKLFPTDVENRLRALYAERESLLECLDRLPKTFCHLDLHRHNMMVRAGRKGFEEAVAIDWEYAGAGALGEELVTLVIASLFHSDIATDNAKSLEEVCWRGYNQGLTDAGWVGDPGEVRFAYAASSALQFAFVAPPFQDLMALGTDEIEALVSDVTLPSWLADRAALTYFLLDLADEARLLRGGP